MKVTTTFAIIASLTLATMLGCNLYAGTPNVNPAKCQSSASLLFANNTINVFDQFNVSITNIVSGSAAAFIIASVVFPNPFTLFAPVALILLGYTVLPSDILYFYGIPSPISEYITTLLIFFMGMTVVGWFKGTET